MPTPWAKTGFCGVIAHWTKVVFMHTDDLLCTACSLTGFGVNAVFLVVGSGADEDRIIK